MLENYVALELERHGHLPLLGRVVELRETFNAYDAVYVALAERLSATLVTADDRLTRAVRDRLQVNVIGTR
jgi:predicted nucleic acid-binding protein